MSLTNMNFNLKVITYPEHGLDENSHTLVD